MEAGYTYKFVTSAGFGHFSSKSITCLLAGTIISFVVKLSFTDCDL